REVDQREQCLRARTELALRGLELEELRNGQPPCLEVAAGNVDLGRDARRHFVSDREDGAVQPDEIQSAHEPSKLAPRAGRRRLAQAELVSTPLKVSDASIVPGDLSLTGRGRHG